MQRKLSIILGAGTSVPANTPSTLQITNFVFSGDGVWKRNDDSYGIDPHQKEEDKYVQAVREFISHIKQGIDDYYSYSKTRVTSYEDIYYVAKQLFDGETGEYDNPAIQPLIKLINESTNGLSFPRPFEKQAGWSLIEITGETMKYIADISRILLSRKRGDVEYLSVFKNFIKSDTCEWVDVFTLNHDTLFEDYVASQKVRIADGFGDPINGVRYWAPDSYVDHETNRLRLFKLHGSVNWFWFDDTSLSPHLGIYRGNDIYRALDRQGNLMTPVEGRPEMLIGRFNKELAYTKSVYADLHNHFYESLNDSDRILISGYGFGDKAINTRIFSWVTEALDIPDRRMVLIHPNVQSLKESSRPAIRRALEDWKGRGILVHIPKGIEHVRWEEVRAAID